MARLTKEGRVIHDITVRFQVYLERLKVNEVKDADDVIRAFDRIVSRELAVMDPESQRSVRRTLKVIRDDMAKTAVVHADELIKDLRKFHSHALDVHHDAIAALLSGTHIAAKNLAWSATLTQPLQAVGDLLEPFVKSWGARAITRVEGAVRNGVAQGKSVAEILKSVRGTKANKFRDGILGNVTKREADAMVHTALQHVNSQAQFRVYEQNDDLIEGYIWISTLDSRTSTQCRSLDGQLFKVGKGPIPPIHIKCRSSTIPKLKGIDLLAEATRASEDGPVPADMTYYEWLKTQPVAFQDDVLGAARGKLFREGGISAEKFAEMNLGKDFKPMTLEEMMQAYPNLF